MNSLALIGAAIAALAYVPLTISVWKGLQQNFATFFLWALLDTIAAVSIYLNGGNFLLPAVYVFCVAGVMIGILRTGTFKWGWIEWITSALVVVCVVVWMFAGNREATIASSVAVGIAGIPLFVDFWSKPREAPMMIYVLFTASNIFSLLAGNDWSIEQRFYPAVCTVITAAFVLSALRRWLPSHRLQTA